MSKTIALVNAPSSAVTSSDLFNQISAGVSLVNGQHVNTVGAETLTITRKKTGVWIILVCILLFPIGLLALLARQTETISVVARDDAGGVRVAANGQGDDQVVDFLNDLLTPHDEVVDGVG